MMSINFGNYLLKYEESSNVFTMGFIFFVASDGALIWLNTCFVFGADDIVETMKQWIAHNELMISRKIAA